MTTAKPPARYGYLGARAGGFALPSYTITRDTTFSPFSSIIRALFLEWHPQERSDIP